MAWRRARRSVQRVPSDWMAARGVDTTTGRPLVIRINRAYADVSNRIMFSTRIEATVLFDDPQPDGMPDEEEQRGVAAAESQLVQLLAHEAVPVAIITGNGRQVILFQSRVRTAFVADGVTPTRIGEREVRFTIESDKDWSEFDRLLAAVSGSPRPARTRVEIAPDAESHDVADADRAVLDQLVRRGADLTVPRDVRHYVSFASESNRRDAAAHLAAAGWDVEQRAPLPEHPDRWILVAVRHGVLVDHEVVVVGRALFEGTAREFGGEYDGWEAAV